MVQNLPEELVVNVDKLVLGKSIQVGELSFENLELLNNKDAVVCRVQLTRAAKGDEDGLEDELEGEEGEEAEETKEEATAEE